MKKLIEVKNLTDAVANYLREEIISGSLAAGYKLNEIELSKSLNVSRPSLREAFRKIENEKLVISLPRKGVFVSPLSMKDCSQVYNARVAIECAAIDSMERKSIKTFPSMLPILEKAESFRMPKNPSYKDMLAYYRLMSSFHVELVNACRNDWLVHFYNSLSSNLARYQMLYLMQPGTKRYSLDAHKEILKLLESGAYEKAKKDIERHLYKTFKRLQEKIENEIGDTEKVGCVSL